MLNEPQDFQYNDTTQIDEHDEPTVPMRREDVVAFVSPIPDSTLPSDEEDVPSPKTATHPFPHQYVQPASSLPVYPVLPANQNISPQNTPNVSVQPEAANSSAPQKRVRGKMIPLTIGMCFVAIQTLLLFRFLLKIVNVSSDNIWVGGIYGVSNVFVLPFRVLFLQLAIPQFFTVELYTLLAVLVYGIVSRIIVHVLKVFFKTR